MTGKQKKTIEARYGKHCNGKECRTCRFSYYLKSEFKHDYYNGSYCTTPTWKCKKLQDKRVKAQYSCDLWQGKQLAARSQNVHMAGMMQWKWQPIETAPKDDGAYLLWGTLEGNTEPYVYRGTWMGEPWNYWNTEKFRITPTHWMPLPDPPKRRGTDA